MAGLKNIDYVLRKLAWMRSQRIWPNGLRYLWTDAFGLVLLSRSMRHSTRSPIWTTRRNSCLRLIACLGGSGAFASGKSPTAMGSISTISPCGSMLLVCSGATSQPPGRHHPRDGVQLAFPRSFAQTRTGVGFKGVLVRPIHLGGFLTLRRRAPPLRLPRGR